MRIPRQEDLAILLMSELARGTGKLRVPLSEISRKHGVSALFLKKLARLLRQAGLVISKEGVGGGYSLAKKPAAISVWDIMQALAVKPYAVPEAVREREACPIYTGCLPQTIQHTLAQAMERSFRTITMKNLVSR